MDITKLPKWAQNHIATLERQRDTAVSLLKDFVDTQTPTNIWTWDFSSHSVPVKGFVQSDRVNMRVGQAEFEVRARADCLEVRAVTSLSSALLIRPCCGNVIEIIGGDR